MALAQISANALPTTHNAITMAGLLDTGAIGQIAFPATQNASAGANTLDDYEEGTTSTSLVASVGSFTTATVSGYYGKVGAAVTQYARIDITSVGTASSECSTSSAFTFVTNCGGSGRQIGGGNWQFVAVPANTNQIYFDKYDGTTIAGVSTYYFTASYRQ